MSWAAHLYGDASPDLEAQIITEVKALFDSIAQRTGVTLNLATDSHGNARATITSGRPSSPGAEMTDDGLETVTTKAAATLAAAPTPPAEDETPAPSEDTTEDTTGEETDT